MKQFKLHNIRYKALNNFIVNHVGSFIEMYLPFLVCVIFYYLFTIGVNDNPKNNAFGFLLALMAVLFWIIKKYFQLSIHLTFLHILRFHDQKIHKLIMPKIQYSKACLLLLKSKYFIQASIIGLLKYMYFILWSAPILFLIFICHEVNALGQLWWIMLLLSFIPIIKYFYSYRFAQYIYYDGDRANQLVTILNSLALSKLLMRHHKIQYLELQVMIIAPIIVISVISGIIGMIISNYFVIPNNIQIWGFIAGFSVFLVIMFFIAPYLKLLELNFYQNLINQRAEQGSKLFKRILLNNNHKLRH